MFWAGPVANASPDVKVISILNPVFWLECASDMKHRTATITEHRAEHLSGQPKGSSCESRPGASSTQRSQETGGPACFRAVHQHRSWKDGSPRLRPDGSGEGGERDLSDLEEDEAMARNLRPELPDTAKHHRTDANPWLQRSVPLCPSTNISDLAR